MNTSRYLVAVALALSCLLFTGVSPLHATEQLPDNFRGLKLGEKMPGYYVKMNIPTHPGFVMYTNPLEPVKKLYGFEVKDVFYFPCGDVFGGINVVFENPGEKEFIASVSSLYGAPSEINKVHDVCFYKWKSGGFTLLVWKKCGYIVFQYFMDGFDIARCYGKPASGL